jgi:hypothetical protein
MSISWNHGRVIADTRFVSVSGAPAADGFRLRLSIEFRAHAWREESPAPVVRLAPAPVMLLGDQEVLLGYAMPESTIPFSLTQYGSTGCHLHDLTLSPRAMEKIEASRGGQGVVLRLKIQGDVWMGREVASLHEPVECRINQSDWLMALGQCGHGQYLLFEVPLLASQDPCAPSSARYLQQAKDHFTKGHFDEAVGACRRALEGLLEATQSKDAQFAAVKAFKGGKSEELDIDQREQLIRQTVMNYTHLAHHHEEGADVVRFDRSSAAMVLGLTASLIARIR